ncbi:unnamed protein product [Vitrella brassicaformis CCMP3155]|uniref:Lipase n=1 Tax=Vitrella brassicaformis (strain CCMP3155) TaxID=1169540 RepID=A0A0G4FYH5_VITBC|nr:unnamed protein product [Vitrella brassicaformis CCMP3155]|eukprot:CEM20070.1 unnamed protein product [Vitrella brassicaformis CCMP3155]
MAFFLASFGLPSETDHFVTTRDGCILRLIRISNPGRPVVFLQHPLLASSWIWLTGAPLMSSAIALHQAGYDVWMGNSRGSLFSANHTSMSVDSEDFWSYTWQHMAMYDIPASIQYVLTHTRSHADGLIYVGHSQGTTQFFASQSMPLDKWRHDSEHHSLQGVWTAGDVPANKAVKLFVALAPIAYINHMSSRAFALLSRLGIAGAVERLGIRQFPAAEAEVTLLREVLKAFCGGSMTPFCVAVDQLVGGNGNNQHINTTTMDWSLQWFPDTTSVMDMNHYEQLFLQKRFGLYDYGWFGNIQHYGTMTAPAFQLEQWPTDIPVALFRGEYDEFASAADVDQIKQRLPPGTVVYDKTYTGFGHVTWLMGDESTAYWLDDLRALLHQYADAAGQGEHPTATAPATAVRRGTPLWI